MTAHRAHRLIAGLLLLLTVIAQAAPRSALAEATIADTPSAAVSGGVTSYTIASPRLLWHTGIDSCPPASLPDDAQIAAQQTETIKRVATYGSQQRTLYARPENCGQGKVADNMVADAAFVYWATNGAGLVKLALDANSGDLPQTVDAGITGSSIDLAIDSTAIYSLRVASRLGVVTKTDKASGASTVLHYTGTSISNIQVSHAFSVLSGARDFVYWQELEGGTTKLKRYDLNAGGTPVDLASGVVAYHADGGRFSCTLTFCTTSDSVFISLKGGAEVRVYNNGSNALGNPIYTTAERVYALVADASNLFFLQEYAGPCGGGLCFPPLTDKVYRRGRGASGTTDLLYTGGTSAFPELRSLKTADGYLFWQANDSVQRLPNNVTALPQTNMRITGMEVTQSVQNLSNSVVLIRGKRTFVRVYVKSDGPAVAGVTAHLSAPSLEQGPLLPVNSSGTTMTVLPSPSRANINQSFLFELPWSWTQQTNLTLRANLNPYGAPPQASFANNQLILPLTFSPPPSLSVEFFRLNYTAGGTTYRPRITDDVLKTYSWMLRAYPLGGTIGATFRPRLWDVDGGARLANWVNQSDPKCATAYPKANERNLCASYYTNGWLSYYRVASMFGLLNVGLNTNAFYYGMISDKGGNFPRGQAVYAKTSVGPAGTPGSPYSLGNGWDTDGSYADWYAAHEIGHSLGRAHPNAGSDNPATSPAVENCGHSRSDPSFPYGNTSTPRAPIGPADGSAEGFDVGDAGFGIAPAVLPSSIWNDVMSYCSNQWLSDYTYSGMYNYMRANPSAVAETESATAATGDFLLVSGTIDGDSAGIAMARRLSSVVNVPPLVAGGYAIRLLDASSAQLANYAFTPEQAADTTSQGFSQLVTFVPGTRTIQISRLSDGKVLTSQAVSPGIPSIGGVALQGAPNPVSGTVTLGWSASDPDGDALTFDVAYSRDGGVTFQPVVMEVSGSSVSFDTAQLGGSGTAILRVTASDGVNSASADSAAFTMADKPPQTFVLTPGVTSTIQYGQLVNFSGMAMDAQDGLVAESGLVWSRAGQTIGTGGQISIDDLPVGVNLITLTATNSSGVSAAALVTVTVGDNLDLPGPTLSAGPGAIGWQVGDGETAAQTAQVSIGNTGSGALSWTASSDQPWLTLSAASGTVDADGTPTMLTLTASPSGLLADHSYVAHLTLTKPAAEGSPAQTINIPVSLTIGAARQNVTIVGANVYLPLVGR